MRELDLRTVCEEASCPNIGECWNHGTATFMILGDTCTRSCGYCNVIHGQPSAVDFGEPERVATAVAHLGLAHVVITSVDRDDLGDGGASLFAATIRAITASIPTCRIEVLIPDFRGREQDLETVLGAGPDILNHNIETVERLVPNRATGRRLSTGPCAARPCATPPSSHANEVWIDGRPRRGPARDRTTLSHLRDVGCDIVTIGQYLRPSVAHLPVARYYTPEEFAGLESLAQSLGFGHVEAGPLVRSSYHAHEQTESFKQGQSPV